MILRAPAARGLMAAGMEDGSFVTLDPRAGYKVGCWSNILHEPAAVGHH